MKEVGVRSGEIVGYVGGTLIPTCHVADVYVSERVVGASPRPGPCAGSPLVHILRKHHELRDLN